MPSLPSRDLASLNAQHFSPNSLANIVIFQTNAQFVDIFSSVYTFVVLFAFVLAKT